MSNPDKAAVVVTRWWWVRHAPVRSDGGNIYGQADLACDTGDREVFEAVAKILPRRAVWYASNLQRTHQTAEAIWAAGFPKPASMAREADFAEQHLGRLQGMNRAAVLASLPAGTGVESTSRRSSCQDGVSFARAVITAEIRAPAARTRLLYPDWPGNAGNMPRRCVPA